jgi:hypothetical protein
MRASRPILAYACAAALLVFAGSWFVSPRERAPAALAPASADEPDSVRESAVLEVASAPAQSKREAPLPPAIRGRLVDASTGDPLAGWTIRLEGPAAVPAAAALQQLLARSIEANVSPHQPAELRFVVKASTPEDEFKRGVLEAALATAQQTQEGTTAASAPDVRLELSRAMQAMRDAQLVPVAPTIEPPSPEPTAPDPVPGDAPVDLHAEAPPVPQLDATTTITLPQAELTFARAAISGVDVSAPGRVDVSYRVEAGTLLAGSFRMAVAEQARGSAWQGSRPVLLDGGTDLHIEASRITFFAPQFGGESAPTTLFECTTDADGRFELPCPDRDDTWLSLDPQGPLEANPARHTIGSASLACSTPITWKVRLEERARAHVRVLDAATDEPVPYLTVGVHGARTEETCTTDAEGRFTTSKRFTVGSIRATFRDGPENADVPCDDPRAEITAAEDEIVFRVTIGPTFRFRCANDPDLASARVRIRGLVAVRSVVEPDHLGSWMTLRGDEVAFLRSNVPVEQLGSGAAFAEIVASDGLRRARIVLPHHTGRGEPLDVTYSLGAQIHGRVLDAEGNPVGSASVDAVDAEGVELDGTITAEDGTWRITGLDPRVVSRIVVASGAKLAERTMPLESGQDHELDVELH